MLLKQSTSVVIAFGPFVANTDGVTLVTSLVSALDNATTGVKLSKNGGALAVRHATVTATTYDAHGNYLVTLDATDTNTLGRLRVQFADATTNLPVWADFHVVPANVYNSLVGGTDSLDVNALKVGPTGAGTAQTARDLGLALPAVAPNANGGLPILSSSGTTLAYTVSTLTTYTGNTVQTGDAYAVVNSGTFGNAVIKTDTGNLVTRITSTLFSGITSLAQWLGLLAGKQTGNTTARTELRATGAGSGTFDETTDSQEAIRDRGDAGWLTATGFAVAGDAMTLAAGQHVIVDSGTVTNLTNLPAVTTDWLSAAGLSAAAATKIANAVEAEIIDETDSEKVLTAITNKIASVNPDLSGLTLAAIAAAVRDVLNTSPAADSLGAMVKASRDRMPGSGTLAVTGDAMTLSAAYDAAKTAAQASVWTVTLASHLDAVYGKLPANGIADETLVVAATDAILAALGTPAQASQIPAGFTAATFSAAGVFAPAALANSPTGGTAPTAQENAAALLDLAAAVEGLSPRELGRLLFAVIAGLSSGNGSHFRDRADTKDRIAATLDAGGNRTAVVIDPT